MGTNGQPNGTESAVLDSWEDVDDAAKLDMTQLNEVFEKMKVDAKQTKDPLDAKAAKQKTAGRDNADLSSYAHVLVLVGRPMNQDDLEKLDEVLKPDFGDTARQRRCGVSQYAIIFASSMDAHRALANGHKYAPWTLTPLDQAPKAVVDLILRSKDDFKPMRRQVRPATNLRVARQMVSRHLNVHVPVTPEQRQQEKEQLESARKLKQAKKEVWN